MKHSTIYCLVTAITISLIITSCERDVTINLPYEGNKIVINSLVMRDSFIYARMTNSTELNNNNTGFTIPSGAKIDIYENDVLKETMTRRVIFGREYFTSTFKSQEGKKYTLKASAPGLANAEGSDVIPAKPSFIGEEFTEVAGNNSIKHRLVIRIKDPAGVKNYYRLRVYEADTNRAVVGPRVRINKSGFYFFNIDNIASNNAFDIFGDTDYRQIVFTDDQFDGREISLTVKLTYYPQTNLYIAPELVQLTQDAYRYLQSWDNQVNNDGNPFTEAVVVYNNISGGYGIVGGMADSIAVVRKR